MKAWLKRNYYRWAYRKKHLIIGRHVVLNKHNVFEGRNVIGNDTEIASSLLGFGSYVANRSVIRKAIIGRYCSIGSNVQTGLGTHPSGGFVSSHPAFYSVEKQAGFSFVKNNIFDEHIFVDEGKKYVVQIGSDVWVGNNVIIMDGITIGHGAIIASGSVVTKNVLPYAIVGGIPAKLIKYKFNEQQTETLLKLNWWEWDFEKVKANSHIFKNIDMFIKGL